MAFPPIPVYPNAIDSDYTLFLVHNTTETKLSADNPAWSQSIDIVPVEADKLEIWADNGFGNIEGELFYYDSVDKNEAGKVIRLKGCSRQLTGKSHFHPKGTWIRSFVIAEHHNQIMEAILKTEDFIGFNYDPRIETLDWRIRNLEALEVVFDDHNCADVFFQFNITEDNPVTGKLATFYIELAFEGTHPVRLDFGDGQYTAELSGTHRYAVNANVDPVLTVSSDQCEVVITPVERLNPTLPPPVVEPGLDIPFPPPRDVPDFTLIPCDVPTPEINLPPLVTPCFSVEGFSNINITGPGINLVSQVTITGPDNPINLPETVTIVGEIPNVIVIDNPVPPTIVIDPPIPPTIMIIPAQSQITFQLDSESVPRMEVDWGEMPPVNVQLTMAAQPVMGAQSLDGDGNNEFGPEFADLFAESASMKVQTQGIGLPSEIKILPPDFRDIKLDTSDLPKKIGIELLGVQIPDSIRIFGPETPIPDSIEIKADGIPRQLELVAKNIPEKIILEPSTPIPTKIIVEQIHPIPERIIVQTDIPERLIVEGIPDTIELKPPEGIPLLFPEKMPEIELVYKGSPIEVKVDLSNVITKDNEGRPCFMMTPCPV